MYNYAEPTDLNFVRIEYLRATARLDANTRVLRGLRNALIIMCVMRISVSVCLPLSRNKAHIGLRLSLYHAMIQCISCPEMVVIRP